MADADVAIVFIETSGCLPMRGHGTIGMSIEGSAIATGFNTIWIDRADRFWEGFQVK